MNELVDPFTQLLERHCSRAAIRRIESGGAWQPVWQAFVESGFLNALMPEDAGGFGLAVEDVAPLWMLLGEHAVPLPVGETMIARGLLARTGADIPDYPIVLATGGQPIPVALVAGGVLVGTYEAPRLVADTPLDKIGAFAELAGSVAGSQTAALRPIAAVLRAHQIAGAAATILAASVDYANTRQQFGKPIGRQQAIQQQLAVMAEEVVAARMAAGIGTRGGLAPSLAVAAIAKHGACIAADRITAISHAVHGAMGISEEHDLQLFTRSLHRWKLADGGKTFWAEQLGAAWHGATERAPSRFLLSL